MFFSVLTIKHVLKKLTKNVGNNVFVKKIKKWKIS